jgi:DNA-directed RNA polymerase specialized sigma24 family protein
VSTRFNGQSRHDPLRGASSARLPGRPDPAEEVAQVALARQELLLGVHRFRLRREDLEDCYSQATLELVLSVRSGKSFASRAHIANSIELRFLSRVRDRRRALSGRSPMQAAMEGAVPLDGAQLVIEVEDRRSEPERLAILRQELEQLRNHALRLTHDQRLVLASQIALGMACEEFCRLHGWSPEKYRKVAQRARARLRRLMDLEEPVPSSPGGRNSRQGPAYDQFSPHS